MIHIPTNTIGPSIPVGGNPWAIAITPNGKTAYVTNGASASVTPIDTATFTAGPPIAVGTQPWGIAILPDQAPVASFSATPATAGSPTSFDAAASTAQGAPIASYKWTFGDGSQATTEVPSTTHAYAAAGTYKVALRVTDTDGTSTARVFTGQTVSLNGGLQAKTSKTIAVPAP